MTDDLARRLNALGALAEPVRRDLYRYVAAQTEPVSRDQAAAGTGLPRHAVKFHLDRLADEGLLEVEFRRLSGRQGPGAGRTAKLYRRSAREVSVSLPERRYDLAGRILADAIHDVARDAQQLVAAVARAAAAAGGLVVAQARADAGGAPPAGPVSAIGVLTACGYEPRVVGDQVILVNCPFHSLAVDHTELVCGMNLEFLTAMTRELGLADVQVRLDPGPRRCCVTLHAARATG